MYIYIYIYIYIYRERERERERELYVVNKFQMKDKSIFTYIISVFDMYMFFCHVFSTFTMYTLVCRLRYFCLNNVFSRLLIM
jgi:hypothetical protein